MKLLWSNLSLGGLYTDADADNADTNATDANDNDDTRRTEHVYIGSLPNEPKSVQWKSISKWQLVISQCNAISMA